MVESVLVLDYAKRTVGGVCFKSNTIFILLIV